MSDAKKKRPPTRAEQTSISLKALQEQWPNSPDGALCARLLGRYAFSRLTDTALGADCGPMTAQAEAGAQKAYASMVKDFATLPAEATPPATRPVMPTLNRHLSPEELAKKDQSPEKP